MEKKEIIKQLINTYVVNVDERGKPKSTPLEIAKLLEIATSCVLQKEFIMSLEALEEYAVLHILDTNEKAAFTKLKGWIDGVVWASENNVKIK